jgi:hypothetical protein
MKENTLLLRRNSVQSLFNGYYYDSNIAAMAGSKLSYISPEANQLEKTDGKMNLNALDEKKGTKNDDTFPTTKEVTGNVTSKLA